MTRLHLAGPLAAALLAVAAVPAAAASAPRHVHYHMPHHQDGGPVAHGSLTITDAFARAAPRAGASSAIYLTVSIAEGADRLIAAESTAASRVELHTHEVDAQGVARMREVAAIPVAADASAVLAPGGLHVMLMGLTDALADGETVPLTLVFEQAGPVSFDVPVRAMAPRPRHGGMIH